MNDKASKIAPTIQTREDFQQFLALLAEDYRSNGQEWENADLGLFLEALGSYSKDIDGYYKNTNQQVLNPVCFLINQKEERLNLYQIINALLFLMFLLLDMD